MGNVGTKDGSQAQPLKVAVTSGAGVAQLSSGGQSSGSLLAQQQVVTRFVFTTNEHTTYIYLLSFLSSCKWPCNAKCKWLSNRKWPPNRRVNRPTANPAPFFGSSPSASLVFFLFLLDSWPFFLENMKNKIRSLRYRKEKKNRHLKQNAPYLYWNEKKKQTLYIVFIVKAGNG